MSTKLSPGERHSHSQENEARTPKLRRRFGTTLGFAAALATLAAPAAAEASSSFALFESGQVRPLALSPDGNRLYAVNTPDNRLEVFHVTSLGLVHIGSVTVGLEPVAVAARNNGEVWVVNHLSDSVSVVDVTPGFAPRVVRTLLVGDEPRDIVFGGPGKNRAFITTAHRGQNVPFDPELTTPGIGRADVWVFDTTNLGPNTLGGASLNIITLFTDTPRALAVSPDGSRVYAAGFHTGNRTTSIHRDLVAQLGGLPAPRTDSLGVEQPPTALIVKYDGEHWVDYEGDTWDAAVNFSLPDKDVFVIDATANPPAQLPGASGFYSSVGTILFNMIVNPVSGKVYVTNTEANNLQRFEGPGTFAGSTVRGHLHESRITVLGNGTATPRHINKHIDYNAPVAPLPNPTNAKSLATPVGMAITQNGQKLYVAALGSSKIAIFDTAQLENDTFLPNASTHIVLDKGGEPVGPTGLVLDETRNRLYVLTRFDNKIAVVNPTTKSVIARVPMYNPEPPSVTEGRQYLYDARFSSSNGESSCASCHVFGDFDSLAWDLGNPDETTTPMPGPVRLVLPEFFQTFDNLDSLKGPMTTQSLRGMANHGPMHWRGDRTMGNAEPSVQPNAGTFDERGAFATFQGGFVGLLGRTQPIPADDMEAFTDFALQIMYPPNPVRRLDNSLTPDQQAGRDHFFTPDAAIIACEDCHRLAPDANAQYGEPFPGFFGTDGQYILNEVPQPMKIPHLRNLYQKVGMFGMPAVPSILPGHNEITGDQVRGFGFLNDGAEDTIFRFMHSPGFDLLSGFSPNGFDDRPGGDGDIKRRQVEQFILAFDSNLAPIVGQQVTWTSHNGAAASPRVDLLLARADEGECDVVVKMRFGFEEIGFLYIGANQFVSSKQSFGPLSRAMLVLVANLLHTELTFTAVPPGSGERIGIDRDEDGIRDGDE
ncbi:YncE family protein [Polyangium jinanense]|uniref:YncE family protein n=1 Tax=Polyangium jinanense TaxID=2829994 RepID=UPI0023418EB6|nr:YncE family protein [Polyangium jinanense]